MQDVSNHRPQAQTGGRRLFKTNKPSAAATLGGTGHQSQRPPAGPLEALPGHSRRHARRSSKTAYFVYLLVGVHHSHADAKLAQARMKFAERLPLVFERNENGAGKCKTWLAVSGPFDRRVFAEVTWRQLALYTGDRAVSIRRGVIQ